MVHADIAAADAASDPAIGTDADSHAIAEPAPRRLPPVLAWFAGLGIRVRIAIGFAVALVLLVVVAVASGIGIQRGDRAFTNYDAIRSEEHTSELQSLMRISYAVFCLKKKKKNK